MREYKIAAIEAFIQYVSADCPFDEMEANEYVTLSETLKNMPRSFLVDQTGIKGRTFYHYAIHLDASRRSPIPASGIMSLSASKKGMERFVQNCGMDGTLYAVSPRHDAILIDASKLAEALHEKGRLPWRIMRRVQNEDEYIYVNPTIACCKKTTL